MLLLGPTLLFLLLLLPLLLVLLFLPLLLFAALLFVPLVGACEGPQAAGDVAIQRHGGGGAAAAAQRRHQAQHRRSRDAGHRGAEGQAQAAHRCGQRIAHGLHIAGAFQRQAGAVEREHHAEKGAQHAQQHQQPSDVGRERRARQRAAFVFHPQAHGGPQAGGHPGQPFGQAGGCVLRR